MDKHFRSHFRPFSVVMTRTRRTSTINITLNDTVADAFMVEFLPKITGQSVSGLDMLLNALAQRVLTPYGCCFSSTPGTMASSTLPTLQP